MTQKTALGQRIRELREARGLGPLEVAKILQLSAWAHVDEAVARARLVNVELGRVSNITKAECDALEELFELPPGELWSLALEDPRKVHPEARRHYEERLDMYRARLAAAHAARRDAEVAMASLREMQQHLGAFDKAAAALDLGEEGVKALKAVREKVREIEARAAETRAREADAMRQADDARAELAALEAAEREARERASQQMRLLQAALSRTPEPNVARSLQQIFDQADELTLQDVADMLHLLAALHAPRRARFVKLALMILIGEQFMEASHRLGERPPLALERLRAKGNRRAHLHAAEPPDNSKKTLAIFEVGNEEQEATDHAKARRERDAAKRALEKAELDRVWPDKASPSPSDDEPPL